MITITGVIWILVAGGVVACLVILLMRRLAKWRDTDETEEPTQR